MMTLVLLCVPSGWLMTAIRLVVFTIKVPGHILKISIDIDPDEDRTHFLGGTSQI
jgi:hypothetical protein